jgi:hypothetical protein
MSVAELKTELSISRVTVYPRSALIQRRGRLTLSGGETRVGIAGLPGELNQDTVRVEVEPEQGLLILDVAAEERLLDPSADAGYAKLKEEYDALLREKSRMTARLSNTLSELALFLDKESLTAHLENGRFQPVNVPGWKQFFSFLRERLADNRALYRGHLFDILELEKRITAAAANLSRTQGGREKEHRITVRVEAPRQGEYDLALNYLQGDVFWYPVYAVAGEPTGKSCTVSLSAVVGQSTGEDWRNVELLLSTAVPRFSCSIPVLSSRRLREADAEMELLKAAPAAQPMNDAKESAVYRMETRDTMDAERSRQSRRAEKKKYAPAPKQVMNAKTAYQARPVPVAAAAAPAAMMAGEAPVGDAGLQAVVERYEAELRGAAASFRSDPYSDALFRVAGSPASPPEPPSAEQGGALPEWMEGLVSPLETLGGYDYRYPVAGRRDVASSPIPQKVPVQRKEVGADFVYLSIPSVNEAVYLKAVFVNEGDNPLPAGPAQVFAGDTLMGSLYFPTLGPGEKGEISLGVERDIKILRRERHARRRRGVVSKEVITDFTVEIELVSHKDTPVTVEVYDRLPVSRQPKEIGVLDFRAAPAAGLRERGIASWSVGLEPRKKTVLTFTYSIRHPADFHVTLEEDPVPFQMGKEA